MRGVLLFLACVVGAHCRVDVLQYLTKFGYRNEHSYIERTISDSIKLFQRTYGLKETGVADKPTLELMATPRCGVPDHQREAYTPKVWRKKSLTYTFDSYTADMSKTDVEDLTKQALGYWSAVTPLKFEQKADNGDIRVAFGAGVHSDSRGSCRNAFDGPGGVLAHAFFPEVGRIHFDDDETFTARSTEGTNYLWVTTHEMGHILGLDHSDEKDAVMNPFYRQYDPVKGMELHKSDIRTIQEMYGTETGEALPPCADKNPTYFCEENRESICMGTSKKEKEWAIMVCEKTCGYCKNSRGERCSPDCKDVIINCQADQCFQENMKGIMKRNCKKTCHYCC